MKSQTGITIPARSGSSANDPDWELARVRASPARKTTAAIASWRSSAASRESSLKAASTGRGPWATSKARHLRELLRQLDPLRLAARERRRRLAELDVVEADVVQGLQLPAQLGDLGEEGERLLDRHRQHVRNRLALEANLERLAVVARALARLARDVDVRQEVHLDLDLAVALAGLAAATADVEREAPGLVAAHLRLGRQ